MTDITSPLPPAAEISRTGIMHLHRYWAKAVHRKNRKLAQDALPEEWNTDMAMLNALGLGLEQTIVYLYNSTDSLSDFEDWITETTNLQDAGDKIRAFNEHILNLNNPVDVPVTTGFLDPDQLACWETNGYVILRNAVSKKDCKATVELICRHIGADADNPATWYLPHPAKQGIMVQLFQDPQLEKNRNSPAIRQAYEQLWGRRDILVNTDRVGFNPPETDRWHFPGPHMHWDVSLQLPVPFGLQGILYLADTAANQGAFTLVPGFHLRLEEWLNSLPTGTNPRQQDLEALGAVPLAASAGDFIIWHHALPHGSSPNLATLPRYVQYINYSPRDMIHGEKWI